RCASPRRRRGPRPAPHLPAARAPPADQTRPVTPRASRRGAPVPVWGPCPGRATRGGCVPASTPGPRAQTYRRTGSSVGPVRGGAAGGAPPPRVARSQRGVVATGHRSAAAIAALGWTESAPLALAEVIDGGPGTSPASPARWGPSQESHLPGPQSARRPPG